MLEEKTFETLRDMIDDCAQSELRYETDNITNDGWDYIENTAPIKCFEKIRENLDDDEINSIDKETVEKYFNEVINNSPVKLREYDP